MTQRTKQMILTMALGLPLVITVMVAGPFSASTAAQPAARMLGPRFPPLLNFNGGQPTPGSDSPANPQLNGNTLQLTTLFSCNGQNNTQVGLVSQDSSGRFRGARRSNNGRDQSIFISGFSASGAPNQFTYTESDPRGVRAGGSGQLMDLNGSGTMNAMLISGNINTLVNLVFSADGNYVSIPVSQAAILGAKRGACGPAVPQVWIPLADTNGDGRGDTIIFDLNGDGIPDPQFYSSPPIGASAVPTANNFALSTLVALIGGVGVWYIGRRQQGIAGPTTRS